MLARSHYQNRFPHRLYMHMHIVAFSENRNRRKQAVEGISELYDTHLAMPKTRTINSLSSEILNYAHATVHLLFNQIYDLLLFLVLTIHKDKGIYNIICVLKEKRMWMNKVRSISKYPSDCCSFLFSFHQYCV